MANSQSINAHYKRETKIMLFILLAPVAIGILSAFFVPGILHKRELERCKNPDNVNKAECICLAKQAAENEKGVQCE